MYKRKVSNPEQYYYDRTEILKTNFLFQDRIGGLVGMTVEEVHVKSDSFIMLCRDKENGRGMRIQLAKSEYGDRGSYLRLSAMEIIYKSEQEKEEWEKKEEARKERLSKKWFEKYTARHPQWGWPKDLSEEEIQKLEELNKKDTPEDVKKKVDEIRRKHQAESQAQ